MLTQLGETRQLFISSKCMTNLKAGLELAPNREMREIEDPVGLFPMALHQSRSPSN